MNISTIVGYTWDPLPHSVLSTSKATIVDENKFAT